MKRKDNPARAARLVYGAIADGLPGAVSAAACDALVRDRSADIAAQLALAGEWDEREARLLLACLGLLIAHGAVDAGADERALFCMLDDVLLRVAQEAFHPVTYGGNAARNAPRQPIPGPTIDTTGRIASEVFRRVVGFSAHPSAHGRRRAVVRPAVVPADDSSLLDLARDICDACF